MKTRRLTAVLSCGLMLVGLTFASAAWAPPGRPVYHPPPHVESPRLEPTHTRPEPRREPVHEPLRQAAPPHEDASAVRQRYWSKITAAYGRRTDNLRNAYVLLQIFKGDVFLTTNYMPDGVAEAPVTFLKLADLSDPARVETEARALLRNAGGFDATMFKIVLDQGVGSPEFERIFHQPDGSMRFDTNLFRQAELYLPGGGRAIPLVRIDRAAPPPRWAAKLNDCCVRTGIPPDWIGWQRLASVPFERDRVQVVSLFADSATGELLGGLDPSRNVRMPHEVSDDPLGSLKTLIEQGDGSAPLIVIGHVENGKFVVEGADGFEVSLDAVATLARRANRPVMLLGCYTQDHMSAHSSARDYAGTLNRLYPRELVPHLLETMNRAGTMREFTESLSSTDLEIYVSVGFLSALPGGAVEVNSSLYKPYGRGRTSLVGILRMFLPCAMGGACR